MSHLEAARAAVEAVAAAIFRPWAEGCAVEARLGADLRKSAQAAALAHVCDAEARACADPGAHPFAVERLVVDVTGVPLGHADLVLGLLRAGFELSVLAPDSGVLHDWRQYLARAAPEDSALARLKGITRIDRETPPDLVLRLGGEAQDAMLCPVAQIQDAVLGGVGSGRFAMRFGLAQVGQGLVEIDPGSAEDGAAIATGFALSRRLERQPILVRGRLVGPLFAALMRAMEALVEAGTTPDQVDAALVRAGYAEGVFAMADRRGLSVDALDRAAQSRHRDPRARYLTLPDRLCALGRTGRAAGAGYFRYDSAGRRVEGDPELTALLEAVRVEAGIAPRRVEDPEIVERAGLALAMTGRNLIDGTPAVDSGLIDLVAILGLGFPRWLGGPMYQAALMGEAAVEALRSDLEPDDPGLWAPSRAAEPRQTFG